MYKFANQVIDAYDDIYGDYLKKFANERPQTHVMTPDEKSRLGDDDYALCYITKTGAKMTKFPINSYDNTWLSNKMFPETMYKLSSETAGVAAGFIKEACKMYNITPTEAVSSTAKTAESNIRLEHEDDIVPSQVKTASTIDMTKIAQVDQIGDNYTHAQYALPSQEHVKLAAKFFEEKLEKIHDREARFKYACALQIRAEELGMGPLGGAVAKYASDSYGGMVESQLISRKSLLDGRDGLLKELSKIASSQSQYTPPQFAQILHGFDKKAGLTQYYDSHLRDPYVATFSKRANTQNNVRWTDKYASRQLTDEEIIKVVNDYNPKIASYIGDAAAKQMKADPVAIFSSLPNDVKEIIANIHEGTL